MCVYVCVHTCVCVCVCAKSLSFESDLFCNQHKRTKILLQLIKKSNRCNNNSRKTHSVSPKGRDGNTYCLRRKDSKGVFVFYLSATLLPLTLFPPPFQSLNITTAFSAKIATLCFARDEVVNLTFQQKHFSASVMTVPGSKLATQP